MELGLILTWGILVSNRSAANQTGGSGLELNISASAHLWRRALTYSL